MIHECLVNCARGWGDAWDTCERECVPYERRKSRTNYISASAPRTGFGMAVLVITKTRPRAKSSPGHEDLVESIATVIKSVSMVVHIYLSLVVVRRVAFRESGTTHSPQLHSVYLRYSGCRSNRFFNSGVDDGGIDIWQGGQAEHHARLHNPGWIWYTDCLHVEYITREKKVYLSYVESLTNQNFENHEIVYRYALLRQLITGLRDKRTTEILL